MPHKISNPCRMHMATCTKYSRFNNFGIHILSESAYYSANKQQSTRMYLRRHRRMYTSVSSQIEYLK